MQSEIQEIEGRRGGLPLGFEWVTAIYGFGIQHELYLYPQKDLFNKSITKLTRQLQMLPRLLSLSTISPSILSQQHQSKQIQKIPQIQKYPINQYLQSPMDIDTPSFDAKRYVMSMLKQNSIRELVRRNNEIDEQIKIHDHEIQSLVFENYSKFISSIDTVRQMKDNICAVDDKLKVLEKSMDKISSLALKIDSTFSVKRKEIQKLDTINKDLEKLKNLCEFPNILQQDIKYYKSIPEVKLAAEVDNLFTKSINFYQTCYKTLISLKQQALIAPIYKESVDKVETIRSTLKALQAQFNKNKMHSNILRNITKKLLIITDDQVSVLRIYLHSWKERFGESCFKSEKKASQLEPSRRLHQTHIEMPQINEELWKQFQIEFSFIFQEIYPRLTLSTQEIQLHITNYAKELFLWGLNHYSQALPLHCTSLKTFVHIHHIISHSIINGLKKIEGIKDQNKIAGELRQKMNQKFQTIGLSMLNFIFGRVKLYFMQEIIQVKNSCSLVHVSEQALKEGYLKSLAPLKQNVTLNFKALLDDMQHFKNVHEIVFASKQKYEQAVHKQIESYLRFLATNISKPSMLVSQEMCSLINSGYTLKLHKNEKVLIEGVVKQFATVGQSGCWFVSAHHFLTSLFNNLAKKVIQNAQKNVEIPKNHNYADLFTEIKNCISKNYVAAANHYCQNLRRVIKFQEQLPFIQDFIDVLNTMFIDNRRGIMKKPSFLRDTASVHQTELLAIKKLHLIEKKLPSDRNGVLLYFVRKFFKELLFRIRTAKAAGNTSIYNALDLYCASQLCYQLINVEQQSQIIAFYKLMMQQVGQKLNQQQADQKYGQGRKLLRQSK